jgi:hypothetical protein
MYGGYATHPVFAAWVTKLEKIRRNKPLDKPLHVIFNWRFHLVGEQDVKLQYDGITVKKSKCEMVGVSVGEYNPEAWKKQFGTEPIDWEKAKREKIPRQS